jgi:DNA-binding NarL/FixJ family response regulator
LSEESKTKVLIVDSAEIWQKILRQFLDAASDMEVVGEINTIQESILMLDEVNPDVILLDEGAKGRMSLEEVSKQLLSIKPDIRIIMCYDQLNKNAIQDSINPAISISDFLVKPYKKEAVFRAIRHSMRVQP